MTTSPFVGAGVPTIRLGLMRKRTPFAGVLTLEDINIEWKVPALT